MSTLRLEGSNFPSALVCGLDYLPKLLFCVHPSTSVIAPHWNIRNVIVCLGGAI